MNYYQDLTLLPDTNTDLYFLWQKLYQQIHLALVENKTTGNCSEIGVSFPEYQNDKYCLGKSMRLFAKGEDALIKMGTELWLSRLKEYVHISKITPVPEKLDCYACFKNIKFKGNKEKQARRRAKRKNETLEQALEYFNGYKEQHSKLPFVTMHSETNGQRFHLFIEKKLMTQPTTGLFSCYGLSNTSTVPIF